MFLKTFSYVSILRTVLNVFCVIVWYGSSLVSHCFEWVLYDLLFSVLCTVLNVFCLMVCDVSSLRSAF